MNERATLRDVARKAGVSLGTASNVLNNRVNVSEDARARVLQAAAMLGYQHQARSSVRPESGLAVVGAVGKIEHGETMTANPFYSHVLAGIERESQQLGLSLMMANMAVDALNKPVAMPPMLLDKQVDGVLVMGTFLRDTIKHIRKRVDKPVVLIDAYAPGMPFDSVLTDNINGAYSAVDYLVKQGHRHIALVGSMVDGYPSIRERRKGYLRALKNHRIGDVYIEDGLLTRDVGYHSTIALLRRSPQITAIFACNDEVALGVLQAARDVGRDVPRDVSVIGFDDIDIAQKLTPQLTTMRVDKVLLGRLAVRLLRDRYEMPEMPALTMLVSATLMVRDTVGVARP
ncbi:MAG: LacI family transcriptional regulator [Anaerolineae bacterium]|nr:LacI family transcriptional regulator [Anaerolineae bacterium]